MAASGAGRRIEQGNVRRFSRRQPEDLEQAALYAGIDAFREHWPWVDALWGAAAPNAAMPPEPFIAFLRTYREKSGL